MIHLNPLPGTPNYKNGTFDEIIEKAKFETNVYLQNNIDGILIENMHDIPYIKSNKFGPEIVATMTTAALEVKKLCYRKKRNFPIGIQVLAGGGREAVAIAKSIGLKFIRNEGYVFAHVGDEGMIESNAGELLRYRRLIDADNIMIFNDIKKKHSSHAITSDLSLLDTAHAAMFFKSDGLILTGKSTGDATNVDDVRIISNNRKMLNNVPLLIGSGVTRDNLRDYMGIADALILGSYFKVDGNWENDLSNERISDFMKHADEIEKSLGEL
jgi:membrane complex biogenesis BtpA family protein